MTMRNAANSLKSMAVSGAKTGSVKHSTEPRKIRKGEGEKNADAAVVEIRGELARTLRTMARRHGVAAELIAAMVLDGFCQQVCEGDDWLLRTTVQQIRRRGGGLQKG